MEHMFKKFLALTALMACFSASAQDNNNRISQVTPKFTIRSQGTNALRRYVGVTDKMNLYDTDSMNGIFSIMPEYTRSFNNDRIAECLLGIDNCDCPQLLVQGLNVENRNAAAIDARNFLLPNDFSSVITIKPRIQNFLVDFFGYIGLDHCYEGLFAWIQFPVTWTKWQLDFCERVLNAGDPDSVGIPAGVLTPNDIPRSSLQPNAAAFFRGNQIADITQDDVTVKFNRLNCGKINNCDETLTRVSEVRFALGYNFLLCEDYHFGLNIQASGPSGNKPCDTFLFSPQNGNDHHWELGVGIDAHAMLWRCEDEDSNLGFFLSANITHMFNSKQRRCFDLCGKPLSRYQLAARVDKSNVNLAPGAAQIVADDDGTIIFPNTVFNNEFSPIGNITTFNVDVKVAVNADVVAMFNYTCGNWSWDLGYNFWGRSCEKIKLDCECPQTNFKENTWVIADDASFFGCDDATDEHFPIAASVNSATLLANANFNNNQLLGNEQINNPFEAIVSRGGAQTALSACSDAAIDINTSIQPVFIKATDINFAKTQGISHKIFSHFGYSWECECWNPFFGIGFEAEFAQHNDHCNNDCGKDSCEKSCKDDCDNDLPGDCVRCGLSQWGIWIKGGVAFN